MSLFLVPASAKGVHVEAYHVLDTHFAANVQSEQVEVEEKDLLGPLHGGQAILDYILDVGRVGVSAELLGLAQEAFERTIQYLKERKQFGVPIVQRPAAPASRRPPVGGKRKVQVAGAQSAQQVG